MGVLASFTPFAHDLAKISPPKPAARLSSVSLGTHPGAGSKRASTNASYSEIGGNENNNDCHKQFDHSMNFPEGRAIRLFRECEFCWLTWPKFTPCRPVNLLIEGDERLHLVEAEIGQN